MSVGRTHLDPTQGVLRPGVVSGDPIYGAEEAIAFLDGHLLKRATLSDRLFPGKRVAMLYGREGSGKTTLLHRAVYQDRALGFIHHFRVQHWNFKEFKTWAETCITIINHVAEDWNRDRRHDSEAPTLDSMTIIIAGVHRFNRAHGQEDAFTTLLHLLARVQAFEPSSFLRVLLLCDENPGQFPAELLSLVNTMHWMAPPNPETRLRIILGLIEEFRELSRYEPDLCKLTWDLDTTPRVLDDDPTHIVHSLVVSSSGCTPREILAFMRRTFIGCAKPSLSGDTTYNAAWIESLLYKLEGNRTCIIPANPVALNEPCSKYAGQSTAEPLLGTANRTCFVRDNPLILNSNAVDNAAPVDGAEANGGKRPRLELQPKSVADALNARLAEQGEILGAAARSAKRLRGKDQDQ